MPPGIDWELWRIFSAGKWHVPSIDYMEKHWTLEDVVDAWMILDMEEDLDEAAEKAQAVAQAEAKAKQAE